MSRNTLILLKTLTWIACLAPLVWLIWRAATNTLGPDPTHTLAYATGRTTLRLLAITLAITPIRRSIPALSWLIKFRRLLGLFTFFYATLHMLTWVGLYAGFDPHAMYADILKRRYVTAGMTAWLLLLALAATSTSRAIRWMGGRNWNRLHRLIYFAAAAGLVHYWWQVKTGVITPLGMTLLIGTLLVARPVLAWRRKRKAESRQITARPTNAAAAN